MKVLLSWIREFVEVTEPAEEIGRRLSLRGLALEGLEAQGDDWLLDFDVTANRPDCLSVAGIAREIAVVFELPFREPHARMADEIRTRTAAPDATPAIPIRIDAPELCRRYVGAVADVRIGPSPQWMADRLTACGIRPISNVVDITNYVLLELGHPMHAFDHDRLTGPAIVVRRATPQEPLTTLDGKVRTLHPDMLVIGDAARACAVAGVMGGADSEVHAGTTRIVLEAAWFKPQSVRATSKSLGLRSEASMRFERGADLTAATVAMARAGELLEQTGAGRITGAFVDVYPEPYAPPSVHLVQSRIAGLLGMEVAAAAVERILAGLGFEATRREDGWMVTAPGWRIDQHRDVDLIEEVGRHFGFEHLPSTFPGVQQAPAPSDPRIARDQRARRIALARGFSEAISFAFIDARHATPFLAGVDPVALANPLSETFAVMRPSLLPGLLAAVSHNRRHGRRDVQLFEVGTRFSPWGESRAIALAWTGLATADHWSGHRRDVDFFDLKGVVEHLADAFDAPLTCDPPEAHDLASAVLVPGRAATLRLAGAPVGLLGQVTAPVCHGHDMPGNDATFVAELDLDALSHHGGALRMAQPLPRFPAAVRDVALLLDEHLSAAVVRGTILSDAPDTLVSVVEFDRYQGTGIPDGKVSLALRLTYQSRERTLTDVEVDTATDDLVRVLHTSLGAVRR
jgi:phenylalanyl-tRNA synthetase beta chain